MSDPPTTDTKDQDDAEEREDPSWEEVQGRLFTVVRPAGMFLRAGEGAVVMRPYLSALVMAVVIDLGASCTYVSRDRLEDWGVDEDQLFAAGLNGVSGLVHSVGPWDPNAPHPIWGVASDDSYEPSRILLADFWSGLSRHVVGEVVVAIPDRNTMLIAGDASMASLAHLVEAAEKRYVSSDRAVSPVVYHRDEEGNVTPYPFPSDHPLAPNLLRLRALLMSQEYTAQKDFLESLGEDEAESTQVADFLVSPAGADRHSICIWEEGEAPLLPRCDRVRLVESGDEEPMMHSVLFEDLERIGALREEPGLWPKRWRAGSFPGAEEISELEGLRDQKLAPRS